MIVEMQSNEQKRNDTEKGKVQMAFVITVCK